MEREITLTVNDTEHVLEVEPRRLLVHALREDLGLTGTHIGCDTGNCGACTVYRDGEAVKSCLQFDVQAEGAEITTVEGMEDLPEAGTGKSDLHPIQEGFKQMHGLQCGFCTPGMIMASKALLEENADPSEREIRESISGNLCRCTGYQNIVKSVEYAADVMNGREPPESPVEHEEAAQETAADGGSVADGDRGSSACGRDGPVTDGGVDLGVDLGVEYPTDGSAVTGSGGDRE